LRRRSRVKGLEERYREYAREAGERITPQKLAVLRFLEGNENHPSVQEILAFVSKKLGQIAQVTVYRLLRDFVRSGFVRSICIDPERMRFDPFTNPHHHVVCTVCGRIWDIPFESIRCQARMMPDWFERTGQVEVVIRAVCKECMAKKD